MGHSTRKNRYRTDMGVNNNLETQSNPLGDKPIGIEFPPDTIFKFKRNRIQPHQEVWGNGSVSYIPDHAEYVEGKGNFVYYRGLGEQVAPPFPSRCVAPTQAIDAVNGIKRRFMNDLRLYSSKEMRLPLFVAMIGRNRRRRILDKLFQFFINEADLLGQGWYLEDAYYCNVSKAVRIFVREVLVSLNVSWAIADKIGEIVGMMIEYDNAYRFRLADLMNEVSPKALSANFPKEIHRLLEIEHTREAQHTTDEMNDVTARFRTAEKLLGYVWKLPKVKKGIRKAIKEIDWEECKLSEGDIYHTCLYGDYSVQGKSQEQRIKILEGYHGSDMSKWPPRIMIKSV